MALGLPYDSPEGRAWAAAITSLMTGHAYATQRPHRQPDGPVRRLRRQRGAHAARAADAPRRQLPDRRRLGACPPSCSPPARRRGRRAVRDGEEHGVRNSQASVLAPTGTIGLMMDCDTTGIEPDLGLVKIKKLVGGGTMSIVNQTIPRALRRLGYDSRAGRRDRRLHRRREVDPRGAAPRRRAPAGVRLLDGRQHDPLRGPRADDGRGAAVPVAARISKTVNMPEEATVEDVEALHQLSWELGLKAVAIYRDNCKVGQPLSTAKKDDAVDRALGARPSTRSSRRIVEKVVHQPVAPEAAAQPARPRRSSSASPTARASPRSASTTTASRARSSSPCRSRARRWRGSWTPSPSRSATACSTACRCGRSSRRSPNMRFEPAGMTDDPDIRFASSIMDYLFRRLALEYLTYDERAELGIFSSTSALQPTLPGVDETVIETSTGHARWRPTRSRCRRPASSPTRCELAPSPPTPSRTTRRPRHRAARRDAPMCMQCGVQMVRAGSCHACPSCGNTSGCS